MKKFLSLMLALLMVMSLSTVAWAVDANTAPSFTVTYTKAAADVVAPNTTFSYAVAFDHAENTETGVTVTTANAPGITIDPVSFTNNSFNNTTSATGTANITMPANTAWPSIGVYYYTVTQSLATASADLAGVALDTNATRHLKVTVTYDTTNPTADTDKDYVAFVTASLADTDLDGNNDVKSASYTNAYQTGAVKVSKEVTGNMGDHNKYFEFTITLTGETGKTYAPSYPVSGGGTPTAPLANPTTITVGTPTTFYLKHDGEITFSNLPYGVTYEVEETDYTAEGYDAATYNYSDTGKKIDSTAVDTVTITNNKGVAVDTGITLDSLPYILLLGLAVAGLVLFAVKRRSNEA